MAPPKRNKDESSGKRVVINRGVWTADEDKRLADYIRLHGPNKWKTVALRAGLNRCGKSCRLRWLNYLRPNIRRGNISLEEEDLILRLHKLLGNRWSLIAGRLPGRTDNEIKNYWNSHLSKKVNQRAKQMEIPAPPIADDPSENESHGLPTKEEGEDTAENGDADVSCFDVNDLFDFSIEGTLGSDWVNKFLKLDERATK